MRAGRLAPALAAALLCTACSVDVEGAPCTFPFSEVPPGGDPHSRPPPVAECPDGQACGWDRRCSSRAFACAASPDAHCRPDEGSSCVVLDPQTANSVSRRCTLADPVCGRWEHEDCTAQQMACGRRDPVAARCECLDPVPGTTTLVADPTSGSRDMNAAPYPTGRAFPPRCRYGRLWDALHAATATFAPMTVAAMDGVFVETRSLTVAANVTLQAADPALPPTVRGSPLLGMQPVMRVENEVQDLRVEGGGAIGHGVDLVCNQSSPLLRDVSVNGAGATGKLSFGIVVNACGGQVLRATVTGADTGLSLEPDATGLATVQGGSFSGNVDGIHLRRGFMTIEPDPATSTTKVRVEGNSGRGVVLDYNSAVTVYDATLRLLDIKGNGAAGIAWDTNPLPAAARVRVRSCTIHGNFRAATGTTPGGVSLPAEATTMSLFELTGTSIWSNGGAQLSVAVSPTVTRIGTSGCGADANWIGGCGEPFSISNPGASYLDVYGTYFSTSNGNVRRATGSQVCTPADFPSPPACE